MVDARVKNEPESQTISVIRVFTVPRGERIIGIDIEYRQPENAEIVVNTVKLTADEAADAIIDYFKDNECL